MKTNWYAVYTKPHCEKRVASLLAKKKIETYYPMNQIISYNSNKRKTAYEPLLSTFVFVNITDCEMDMIRKTSCVINFIYWLGKPAVIQHDEIINMQYFTKEYSNVKLQKKLVNPNESTKIISDPHIDFKGKVISVKNTLLELWLPSLGYMLVAELEKSNFDSYSYELEGNKLVS